MLAPHGELDGVLAGVRSVTRILQCLTEKIVIGCLVSVAALNAVVVGDVSVSQNGRHEQTGQGEGRNFLLGKLFKNPRCQAGWNKIVPFGFSLQRQKMVFFCHQNSIILLC